MSGSSSDGSERRDGSRLEVDDPRYCKECGTALPEMCVEDGWHPLGGNEPPEYCGSCLAEAMFA
jgi:hypothetical protein